MSKTKCATSVLAIAFGQGDMWLSQTGERGRSQRLFRRLRIYESGIIRVAQGHVPDGLCGALGFLVLTRAVSSRHIVYVWLYTEDARQYFLFLRTLSPNAICGKPPR